MHQGTILRDCQHGTGLINSNGNKYEFTLEDHWSSEEVPAAGMRVSFELNGAGQLFRVYSGDPDSALPVGTVLRDAQNGPGLVICAGKKYLFTLEKEWMSEVPPAAGMRVYVATTEGGQLQALKVAPRKLSIDAGALREKLGGLGEMIPGNISANLGKFDASGLSINQLVYFAVVLFFWMGVNFVQVSGAMGFTFNQGLGIISSGNPMDTSFSFYNFLAWVAMALIFLPLIWKDPRARLGVFAPPVFMLLMLLVAYIKVQSMINEFMGGLGSLFGNQARREMEVSIFQFIDTDVMGWGLLLGLPIIIIGAFACYIMQPMPLQAAVKKINTANRQPYAVATAPAPVQTPAAPVPSAAPAAAPAPVPTPAAQAPATPPAPVAQPAAAATVSCPACHQVVGAGDAFCTSCGHKLR